MIMDLILTILLVILFICYYYLLIRNNRVYEFRETINAIGYNIMQKHIVNWPVFIDEESYNDYIEEHKRLHNIWQSLTAISYEKMLFSIKPLKPKYWLDKEQIEFLNYYESK